MSDTKAPIASQKDVPTKYSTFLVYDRDDPKPLALLKIFTMAIFVISIISLDLGGINQVACNAYNNISAGLCDVMRDITDLCNVIFGVCALLSAAVWLLFFFHLKCSRIINIILMLIVTGLTTYLCINYFNYVGRADADAPQRFFIITSIKVVTMLVCSVAFTLFGSIYLLTSKKVRETLKK